MATYHAIIRPFFHLSTNIYYLCNASGSYLGIAEGGTISAVIEYTKEDTAAMQCVQMDRRNRDELKL